ncbi:MAG: TIGR01212 family radical SAM protein [Planctomycetes bacterium]|nr:TIGR01212 family radical SAM protein [Planctomycetota bacterium]
MASTKPLTPGDPLSADHKNSCDTTTAAVVPSRREWTWQDVGLPYYSCGFFLRRRFGRCVQKVSIDAGFTCPNVDGTVTTGGCTFCDNRSFSPSRRLPRAGIIGQIDQSISRMRLRYRNCHDFLAYFQPATNTYAPVERLRTVYEEALAHPQVVGLVIGTRPDCVPNDVLDLLEEFARRMPPPHVAESLRDSEAAVSEKPLYVAVEYGMQTIHNRSLDWMNRGHHHDAMLDAVERSRGRGFEIGAHVILGLPGESHDDMMATARELGRLSIDAVKIHNLYCVKNTLLADQVARGEVRLMERAEYVRTVVDFIEHLPPTMIVDRISGDAPPDYFIGPTWCLDKPAVKTAVLDEFARRGTSQGNRYLSKTF